MLFVLGPGWPSPPSKNSVIARSGMSAVLILKSCCKYQCKTVVKSCCNIIQIVMMIFNGESTYCEQFVLDPRVVDFNGNGLVLVIEFVHNVDGLDILLIQCSRLPSDHTKRHRMYQSQSLNPQCMDLVY